MNFTGGSRSGGQIDKKARKRTYKYSKKDCDLILGVNSNNGDCYIIPVEKLSEWGDSKELSTLSEYKENWEILQKLAS